MNIIKRYFHNRRIKKLNNRIFAVKKELAYWGERVIFFTKECEKMPLPSNKENLVEAMSQYKIYEVELNFLLGKDKDYHYSYNTNDCEKKDSVKGRGEILYNPQGEEVKYNPQDYIP